MPKAAPFEPVLSGKALSFLSTLSKRSQRRLVDLLFRLAEFPHQPGDYDSLDDVGRRVQHLQVGALVISYWADDAARELRITDIEEL
jgi:hypothetical protein